MGDQEARDFEREFIEEETRESLQCLRQSGRLYKSASQAVFEKASFLDVDQARAFLRAISGLPLRRCVFSP